MDLAGLGLRKDHLLGLGELPKLHLLWLRLVEWLLGLGKHLRGLLCEHLALRLLLRHIIHYLALGIYSLSIHILRYRLGELHLCLSKLRLLLELRLGHGVLLELTIGGCLNKLLRWSWHRLLGSLGEDLCSSDRRLHWHGSLRVDSSGRSCSLDPFQEVIDLL